MHWIVFASYLAPRLPPSSLPFLFHMLSCHLSLPCSSTAPLSFLICPPSYMRILTSPPPAPPFPSPLLSCFQLVHPLHWPRGHMHIQWSYSGLCRSLLCLRKCVCVCLNIQLCSTSRRECLWTTLACVLCCFSHKFSFFPSLLTLPSGEVEREGGREHGLWQSH